MKREATRLFSTVLDVRQADSLSANITSNA